MYLFVLDVWQFRDETGNFEQKHDAELIKEAKRYSNFHSQTHNYAKLQVFVFEVIVKIIDKIL